MGHALAVSAEAEVAHASRGYCVGHGAVAELVDDLGGVLLENVELLVPDVPPPGRHVAEAVTRITNRRLQAGWSVGYCFEHAAFGSDAVIRELAAVGISMDRKTARGWLHRLYGPPVGQLPDWYDHREQEVSKVRKSGAFLYRLQVPLTRVGELASGAVAAYTASCAALGGIQVTRRVRACLNGAVRRAVEGSRDSGGHWLTRRCIDAGLTEDEARRVLREYVGAVPQRTGHLYTASEAERTLRSAYRRSR